MSDPELTCDAALDIMSATLDAEANGEERRRLGAHLAECAECRVAEARLSTLDRRLRLRAAEPVPDLRAVIMATSRPAVLGRNGWMRPGLAWVALVLVAQNVTALFAGRLTGADVHLARHMGAFGVALGVGMLYVAWRPHRAYGLLPFVGALALTMVMSAGFDVVDSGRTGLAELGHLTELVGVILIWAIAGSPGRPKWTMLPRRDSRRIAIRAR